MIKTKLKIGAKVFITDSSGGNHVGSVGVIVGYPEFWDYNIEFKDGTTEYYDSWEIKEHLPVRGFIALHSGITMPTRAYSQSAGYDIFIPEDFMLMPGESRAFDTGLSSYMLPDEVLQIYVRSSVGINGNVTLSNTVSIIDADFRGQIKIALRNNGNKVFSSVKEVAVAQGIFTKYLLADNDNTTTIRNGGIGSSTK